MSNHTLMTPFRAKLLDILPKKRSQFGSNDRHHLIEMCSHGWVKEHLGTFYLTDDGRQARRDFQPLHSSVTALSRNNIGVLE